MRRRPKLFRRFGVGHMLLCGALIGAGLISRLNASEGSMEAIKYPYWWFGVMFFLIAVITLLFWLGRPFPGLDSEDDERE